jgi:hypothetical protein
VEFWTALGGFVDEVENLDWEPEYLGDGVVNLEWFLGGNFGFLFEAWKLETYILAADSGVVF